MQADQPYPDFEVEDLPAVFQAIAEVWPDPCWPDPEMLSLRVVAGGAE